MSKFDFEIREARASSAFRFYTPMLLIGDRTLIGRGMTPENELILLYRVMGDVSYYVERTTLHESRVFKLTSKAACALVWELCERDIGE